MALPRPPMVEDKAKPCPYPRAELARGMLGWHAVPTLPEAIRTARGAAPARCEVKRGTGDRDVGVLASSVIRNLNSVISLCPLIQRPFVSTWEGGVATNGASLLSPTPL